MAGDEQSPEGNPALQCEWLPRHYLLQSCKPRNIGTTGELRERSMVSLQESHPGLCLAAASTWHVLEASAWAGAWDSDTIKTVLRAPGFFSLTLSHLIYFKDFSFDCVCSCECKYLRGPE